jgi:hypothetical protein
MAWFVHKVPYIVLLCYYREPLMLTTPRSHNGHILNGYYFL